MNSPRCSESTLARLKKPLHEASSQHLHSMWLLFPFFLLVLKTQAPGTLRLGWSSTPHDRDKKGGVERNDRGQCPAPSRRSAAEFRSFPPSRSYSTAQIVGELEFRLLSACRHGSRIWLAVHQLKLYNKTAAIDVLFAYHPQMELSG